MSSEEIVDPTLQHDVSVRRVLIHLVLPLFALVMGILAVTLIGLHSYRTTRTGVKALTHELLGAVQHYIAQEVSDYIMPAAAGNIVASGMIEHVPVAVQDKVFYSYGGAMLNSVPQLQSFYLADDSGHFTLITRGKDGKGQERTTLQVRNGHKVFHHDYFTADGVKSGEADDAANDYDPRNRPWYTNTADSKDIKWTKPYLFATDKQFVMTSSLRFKGLDGHTLVFATNISLNELSSFLDHIKVGKSGNAIILDSKGRVMAGRHLMQQAEAAGWDPDKMVINPKTHPVFARGFDHYRVHGLGPAGFELNGKRYVTIASPLPNTSEDWVLLLSAPESDFASFAKQSSQQSLQFAGVIVVFSLVLAVLLVRQVRRSERSDRKLRTQQSQITRETSAVQQVAATPHLFDPANDSLVLTEQLANLAAAHRASVWRFMHDGSAIICEDSYDQKQDTHSGGFEISRSEMEGFFKAVEEGEAFNTENATADPRTAQFERLVMRELGTHGVAVYPVHGGSGVIGALVLEDANMAPHLLYFIDLMAGVASMRLNALYGSHIENTEGAASGADTLPSALQQAAALPPTKFDNMLMRSTHEGSLQSSGIYPEVAVLVITFSDPVVDSSSDTQSVLDLINHLATEVQRIAMDSHLFAVEVAGHRLICMAGCTEQEDPTALMRMAEAALTMRETCMGILAAANLEPVFSMGLDYGPAFGGTVGAEPQVFNLWGQTVSVAELMAQGAVDAGTIQVTERVYSVLRDRYLFRSRGAFFAPHLGLSRVYVLAARR